MTLVYFVLLIGILVFVHELGHFWFAKLFGVKVLKFSLGFGPKAIGFSRGETEYRLSWLPLGGYVKMLGDNPSDKVRVEDRGRAFHHKPLWQRYIIVFAGPAFNIIFPTAIYFVYFAAQTHWSPAIVGRVFPDQPAQEAGMRAGDRILAIDGRKISYWQESAAAGGGASSVKYNIASRPGKPLLFRLEREGEVIERFITPRRHTTRNQLGIVEHYGLIGILPDFELPQISVRGGSSPAARAKLMSGDLITSIDGHVVTRWADLKRSLKKTGGRSIALSYLRPGASISKFFNLFVMRPGHTILDPDPRHDGATLDYETGIGSAEFHVAEVVPGSPAAAIGLNMGDRIVKLDGEPVMHWALIEMKLAAQSTKEHRLVWLNGEGKELSGRFRLKKVTYNDEYKNAHHRYVFGARNATFWRPRSRIPVDGRFAYALTESVRKTGEVIAMMAVSLLQVFRGAIPGDTIGGPVALAHLAGVAAEKGWQPFLEMMALISINLGLINLLPVPILDGGHILFFTLEALRRKPLSLRTREIASYAGLFALVSLMVFALKNDIVRYWLR